MSRESDFVCRMSSLRYLGLCLMSTVAHFSFAQRPTLTYRAPPSGEEVRPVLTSVVVKARGNDYAIELEFNKAPWGADCATRCANATLFLDTDDKRLTGLKLSAPAAAENGADLAVTIQGTRKLKEGLATPVLLVKVTQFADAATSLDDGTALAEFDAAIDTERVKVEGAKVSLLVDGSLGNQPTGPRIRVVYTPPESQPLTGTAKGFGATSAHQVEIFKGAHQPQPSSKKKSRH